MNNVFWSPGATLDEVIGEVVIASMRYFNFNRERAAKSLGISLRSFNRYLEDTGYKGQLLAEKKEMLAEQADAALKKKKRSTLYDLDSSVPEVRRVEASEAAYDMPKPGSARTLRVTKGETSAAESPIS